MGIKLYNNLPSHLKIVKNIQLIFIAPNLLFHTGIYAYSLILTNVQFIIYILCRQMYTVLCYLTQFLLLNAAQHVSSLYKAHLEGLFC
jgi:hypothetical protein